MPFGSGISEISAAALAYPPVFDRARSVAHYNGPVKKLIHSLKYADRHEGLTLFGQWMARAGQDILKDADKLVPVPLSRKRLWSRRFNQSALLAGAVAVYCKKPVDYLSVSRVKHTRAQVGLTRGQRIRNVSAAFSISEDNLLEIQGKRIVLIDDVMTTGATINSCTRVLKRAGAARVDILTLARVVNPIALTV